MFAALQTRPHHYCYFLLPGTNPAPWNGTRNNYASFEILFHFYILLLFILRLALLNSCCWCSRTVSWPHTAADPVVWVVPCTIFTCLVSIFSLSCFPISCGFEPVNIPSFVSCLGTGFFLSTGVHFCPGTLFKVISGIPFVDFVTFLPVDLLSNSVHFVSEFSVCVVEGWYSLEQYIGFEVRLAFNYYCSLHQVWREAEN